MSASTETGAPLPAPGTSGAPGEERSSHVTLPDSLFDCILVDDLVAAHPPSTWQAARVDEVRSLLERSSPRRDPETSRPPGLYVHIPFRPEECDSSYDLSSAKDREPVFTSYIDTLLQELALYAGLTALREHGVSCVYVGGGAPSVLPPDEIRRLGAGLRCALPFESVREVAFECAPHTVGEGTPEALRAIGVTRVSLDALSFSDELLRRNGRAHLRETIERDFARLRTGGFQCLNLDLMSGLPGESRDAWWSSIHSAIGLDPDSVTLRQREMSRDTGASAETKPGCSAGPFVPRAERRDRIAYGFEALERAGYTQISGYTAVKDPHRHAFVFQDELWSGSDMIGLGAASYSHARGAHFQNDSTLERYATLVREGTLPIARARFLSDEERLVRETILQLKKGSIERQPFCDRFHADVLERLGPLLFELASQGLLELSSDRVRLTRRGLLHVDELVPRFHLELHRSLLYT